MIEKQYLQFFRKVRSRLSATPLVIALACAFSWYLWVSTPGRPSALKEDVRAEKAPSSWDKLTIFSPIKDPHTVETLALKERLESELSSFDSVESVHIALPITSLDDSLAEKPAPSHISVIVHTKPDIPFLPLSLVDAITHYLCSALAHLHPENIVISDQNGIIYSHQQPSLVQEKAFLEKLLTTKLLAQCEKVFPKNSFLLSVLLQPSSVRYNDEDGFLGFITISLNQRAASLNAAELSERKEQVRSHIEELCTKYHVSPQLAIDVLPLGARSATHPWLIGSIYLLCSISILIAAYSYLFTKVSDRYLHKRAKITGEINMSKLVEVIQGEHPKRISILLSYLDPQRSEAILRALPQEKREEILRNSRRSR